MFILPNVYKKDHPEEVKGMARWVKALCYVCEHKNPASRAQHPGKDLGVGLVRWLNSAEHALLFHRSWAWFSAHAKWLTTTCNYNSTRTHHF